MKLPFMNYLWKLKNIIYSLLKKKTIGARALVIEEEKVLLVKHTYLPSWYMIGGGVDPGKSPIQAVRRELIEEAGIECIGKPTLFGIYHSTSEGRDDYIAIYIVSDFKQKEANSTEIEELKWHSLNELPDNISLGTLKRIKEYKGLIEKTENWWLKCQKRKR